LVCDTRPLFDNTVVLEEISAERAVLAVERPYPPGLKLEIRAEGLAAPAAVVACRRRETDYWLELRFVAGFQWNAERWRPDHLYLPPSRQRSRGAAASALPGSGPPRKC
jgi:hypothetical protein